MYKAIGCLRSSFFLNLGIYSYLLVIANYLRIAFAGPYKFWYVLFPF